jgi:RNA polymerase sigma factor (sigma-70 family)
VTAGEPTSDGEQSEDDALRAALAALPERQRLAAFLRYYADLDYEDIAAVLGITPGTVGATLNAAHAGLRRSLEEVRT